jgi:hypothetical protein
MNTWTVTGIIEIGCMIIMVLIVVGIFIQRIVTGKGLGARAIQFIAVGFILPIILILALEKILSAEATAALLGALAGYLLSGVGKYEPKETSEKRETKQEPEQPAAD